MYQVIKQLEDAHVSVQHRSRTKKDSSDEVVVMIMMMVTIMIVMMMLTHLPRC